MLRVSGVGLVWALVLAATVSAQSTAPTGEHTPTESAAPPAAGAILNMPRAGALAAGWVRVRVDAPVRILRDPRRMPLTVLHPGNKVRVRDYKEGWLLVEFDDKRWGKRLGWVLESQCEW